MPKKTSLAASTNAPPKQKPVRKRSTDRHRRAASFINDVEPDAFDITHQTTTTTTSSAPIVNNNTNEPEDVFSNAAARLDLTETYNYGRSKLQNVIKKAHRQHQQTTAQIRRDVETRVPILQQCSQLLTRLNHARTDDVSVHNVHQMLRAVDEVCRAELKMLVALEQSIVKQGASIVKLHKQQSRAFDKARDVVVRLSEDPTFVYRTRADVGVVTNDNTDADDQPKRQTHSAAAAAVCREIDKRPLVLYGVTEIQCRQFAT